jgi:ECF transporter S component (folate family)
VKYIVNSSFIKKCNTKKIVFAAMFISINVILTHVFSIQTPFIRIDLGFLPIVIFSILVGPVAGAVVAAISDVLGCLIFSPGMFYPGFTLSAFTSGMIYGLYFFNKKISINRVILASITVFLLVDLCMNTLWLSILYHKGVQVLIVGRAIKGSIMLPFQVILIYNIHRRLINRKIPNVL